LIFIKNSLIEAMTIFLHFLRVDKIDEIGDKRILQKYKDYSSFPEALTILTTDQVINLVKEVRNVNLSTECIISSAFKKSKEFAKEAKKGGNN
jgi:hypothetical protein